MYCVCWLEHPQVFVLLASCPAGFSYLLPSWSLTFSSALTCPPVLFTPIIKHTDLPSSSVAFFLPIFFPNRLWPQIPSMVLQLFAFVKPLHRYQSSFLQQHSSAPVKPCGRCAPKQFVFLWRDWSFSASVRCHYEPWFPQVPSKVLHTSPAPEPPLQPCKGISFSPWLSSTWDWPSGEPCLGPAWRFHLLLPTHPSLDLSTDCFCFLTSQKGHAAGRDAMGVVRRGFHLPVFAEFHMWLPIISFYSVLQAEATLITCTWFSRASTGG